MTVSREIVLQVLECVNRNAGTTLTLPADGDLSMAQFGMNSFNTLAFIIDLERTFDMEVDESALTDGSLSSIYRVAQYVVDRKGKAA